MPCVPNKCVWYFCELVLEKFEVCVAVEGKVQAALGSTHEDGAVWDANPFNRVFAPVAKFGGNVVWVLEFL